jgi:DNA-binding transcriptional LysR family regulator
MELRQLKYFIGVAEELHFGNAAKGLFVSQSALSQQIQTLENELGIDLFVRSKRIHHHKVELTEAGNALLIDARKILFLCQKAADNARRIGIKNSIVKLGIFKMLLRERLDQLLHLFDSTFPQMEIRLVEFGTAQQVQDALMEDSIDIGLTHSETRFPDLIVKTFSEIQVIVVMHTNHPLSAVAAVTPTMLKNEKWIDIHRSINPIYEKTERIFSKVGVNREVIQEVSNYELLCSLAGIGKGIGLVSTSFDLSRETNLVAKTIVNNHGQPMQDFFIQYALAYRRDRESPVFEHIANLIG